jgi:hypothetical protein
MLGRHESWRTLIVAWVRLSHAGEKFPANVERIAVEAGEFFGSRASMALVSKLLRAAVSCS